MGNCGGACTKLVKGIRYFEGPQHEVEPEKCAFGLFYDLNERVRSEPGKDPCYPRNVSSVKN
ncbi:hypothetical protein EPI10_023827 [Gossypium australe]|uniref:Uncharacterized protein n=1 Tax=Gossypium australe TaxID=47621 RepID=A0A5B6VWI8_9ROSI|nr:hypothetical protein EPI10_023827 [Gossypium australe]